MTHEAKPPIVLVGASLAGGRAAEYLRRQKYEGRIVVVGDEPHAPYDRPPPSKKLLRGQLEEEKLFFRPASYYAEHAIELELGVRATRLVPHEKTLVLSDGRALAYDKLLIATGAHVRRLTCEGSDLGNVFMMRTLSDSKAIASVIRPGARIVVIGAGVIGSEVAAACREEGCIVTMLETEKTPLVRAFGHEIGAYYAGVHRDRGVDLRLGVSATRLRGEGGKVTAVELGDGTEIACDAVVVGIGIIPTTDWLEDSGIATDRGVLVDVHCRTNAEDVYAAGDVARFWNDAANGYVALESVDNAQGMAAVACERMLGRDAKHVPVPYFWSDQYDLKLQSVGYVGNYDRVIYRGSTAKNEAGKLAFAAFHVRGKKLVFFVGVNRLKEMAGAKKLIGAGVDVTDAQLADETFALGSLVP
ncbi:FAD-dependent oxidoreductase [soil metagenome]